MHSSMETQKVKKKKKLQIVFPYWCEPLASLTIINCLFHCELGTEPALMIYTKTILAPWKTLLPITGEMEAWENCCEWREWEGAYASYVSLSWHGDHPNTIWQWGQTLFPTTSSLETCYHSLREEYEHNGFTELCPSRNTAVVFVSLHFKYKGQKLHTGWISCCRSPKGADIPSFLQSHFFIRHSVFT